MREDFRRNTLIVEGYKELNAAFRNADAEVASGMKRELKDAGEIVRKDAAARMGKYDARSAAGFRTIAQAQNLWVAQSIRGTGKKPQFGALQMVKALIPALDAKQDEIEHRFEALLDHVVIENFGL